MSLYPTDSRRSDLAAGTGLHAPLQPLALNRVKRSFRRLTNDPRDVVVGHSIGVGTGATRRPSAGFAKGLLCRSCAAANASRSISPDFKKSRKLIPLYLHVSLMLNSTTYCRTPLGVPLAPNTLRSRAKALIACSALLLFQGTPSWSRNVKSLSWFFSNRFLYPTATSVL